MVAFVHLEVVVLDVVVLVVGLAAGVAGLVAVGLAVELVPRCALLVDVSARGMACIERH